MRNAADAAGCTGKAPPVVYPSNVHAAVGTQDVQLAASMQVLPLAQSYEL